MIQFIVGVDEVGRGPIAGPLCVGACAVRRTRLYDFWKIFGGAKDSKQLAPNGREHWFSILKDGEERGVVRAETVFISHTIIDERGMSHALHIGVASVLKKLKMSPKNCSILLDGSLKAPAIFQNQKTIIGGDEKELLIAVASIAAKVRRDAHMTRVAAQFPQYGFEKHKGYGTRAHYSALHSYGPSPIHRLSFLKSPH